MARLLTIPTTRPVVSMEERRAPEPDADIIPLDDVPEVAPVIDAGVGTGGEAAQAEDAAAIAATTPEAPAAAGADPAADGAADSSVTATDAVPAVDDGTTPPAADVPEPAVGTADVPAVDAPVDDVPAVADVPSVDDVPAEPTIDAAAETGSPDVTDPVPAEAAAGDIAPVPDDVAPVAPVETVNEPAAEAAVTDAPEIDPATDVAAAPAGEEQAAAVADMAEAAAAAVDSPVDAGVEPVAPGATQADVVPDVASDAPVDAIDIPATDTPGDVAADTPPVEGSEPSLPEDVASDVPPVTGEAPVAPEADFGAPSGEAVADDLSASTVPGDASADPVDGAAAPVDAAAAEPAEPVDPVDAVEPEEMTSSWVDGVQVDAEEVKQKIEEAANDVADADNVTSELEDAAVALEELSSKISENLAEDNPIVSDTTVNLTRIVAEKSLERIGEVVNLPVSMESAATPRARLMITLEAIDGKLAQIWEAIKKALTIAWEAVVKFFKTLFDSAFRVKQAIVELREAVKGMNTDEAPTADKVTGGVVNDVGFENWDSVDKLKQRLSKFTGAMNPFLENSKQAIHDVIVNAGNKMVEICKEQDSDKDYQEVMLTELLGTMLVGYSGLGTKLAMAVADGGKRVNSKSLSGLVETDSGEIPGGYRITALDFDNNPGRLTNLHLVNVMFGKFVHVSRTDYNATEAPAATAGDLTALLDTVEELVDVVIASKDGVSKFESDIASFRRQAESAMKEANVAVVGQNSVSTYIRLLSSVGPSIVRQNSTLISLSVKIANGVVKYVAASAKLYPSFGKGAVKGETAAPQGAPALAAPAA